VFAPTLNAAINLATVNAGVKHINTISWGLSVENAACCTLIAAKRQHTTTHDDFREEDRRKEETTELLNCSAVRATLQGTEGAKSSISAALFDYVGVSVKHSHPAAKVCGHP
jgi:hypothetical protein